ncbi:hypothetical protein ACMA1I_10905 [Pontibacter sp. 13R65]|uniref:hypothetical protein n=1 Tax=Pontibacter sp. 13R65 TaxID=3127458 RepID=UPI00301D694C
MKYNFYTNQFGVDKKGLHLLRSKQKFIPYSNIDSITLKRGRVVKNWLLLLLFGLCCLLFASYSIFTLNVLSGSEFLFSLQAEKTIAPIVSAFIGVGAVLMALQERDIMIVRRKGKKAVLLMSQLIKQHQTDDFIAFISQRLGYKKVFVSPDFDKENKATPVPRKTRRA